MKKLDKLKNHFMSEYIIPKEMWLYYNNDTNYNIYFSIFEISDFFGFETIYWNKI